MKSVNTLKKMLCLLLTICIALSCAAITVSADDTVPGQEPAKTVLPIDIRYAEVNERNGYTVFRITLDFGFFADDDDDTPFFWDVFDSMDKDVRLPFVCIAAGKTLVSGYAVPHFWEYEDGETDDVTNAFDLYQEDGTPGIKMANLPIFKNYAIGQYAYVPETDFRFFQYLLELPEGLFSGEDCTSAAGEYELDLDGLQTYPQSFIPEWMGTAAAMNIQMWQEFSKTFPKLSSFLFNKIIRPVLGGLLQSESLASFFNWCAEKAYGIVDDLKSPETGTVVKGIFRAIPLLVLTLPIVVRCYKVLDHYMRDVFGMTVTQLFTKNSK